MSITNRKILNFSSPVTSLLDQPIESGNALKEKFQASADEVKNSLNGLIDDLVSSNGASNIGCLDDEGLPTNIQENFIHHDNIMSATNTVLTNHKDNTANPHNVTKAQVGLGNCDNTSDLNKPISIATQEELTWLNENKANQSYVDAELNTKISAENFNDYRDTTDFAISALSTNKADVTYVQTEVSNKADLVDGKVPTTQLDISVDDIQEPTYGTLGTALATIDSNVIGLNNTMSAFNDNLANFDFTITGMNTTITDLSNNKADLVDGKVPSSQLPSYVDEVIEYANLGSFPVTGETGRIYINKDTNLTYRWSGTVYVEISQSLALGETSATAYRGDRGKTAYDHSQSTGNPHGTTASDVGAYTTIETDNLLDGKADLVGGYIPKEQLKPSLVSSLIYTSNNVIYVTGVDLTTDKFTSVGHTLQNGDRVAFTLRSTAGYVGNPLNLFPAPLTQRAYFVVGVETDKFQLSLTSGGAVIDITAGSSDWSKIQLEVVTVPSLSIDNLPNAYKYKVKLFMRAASASGYAIQLRPTTFTHGAHWCSSLNSTSLVYTDCTSTTPSICSIDAIFDHSGNHQVMFFSGVGAKYTTTSNLGAFDIDSKLLSLKSVAPTYINSIILLSSDPAFFVLNNTKLEVFEV